MPTIYDLYPDIDIVSCNNFRLRNEIERKNCKQKEKSFLNKNRISCLQFCVIFISTMEVKWTNNSIERIVNKRPSLNLKLRVLVLLRLINSTIKFIYIDLCLC